LLWITSKAVTVFHWRCPRPLMISFTVIAVSYVKRFPWIRRGGIWRHYADAWALVLAGQLHRQVIEELCGSLKEVKQDCGVAQVTTL
jgi:hypothetical protein